MSSEPTPATLEQQPTKQDAKSDHPSPSLAPLCSSPSGSTLCTMLSSSLSLSAATSTAPAAWLPTEVLLRIFGNLDSPLDLYRASRVNNVWRSIAIDSRLWESYYWAFYRSPSSPRTQDEGALLASRKRHDHKLMRAWLDQARATAPPSPFGALCVTAPSGASTVYEPLGKGIVLIVGMGVLDEDNDNPQDSRNIWERVQDIVETLYGPQGPHDAEEACKRVMEVLLRECGKRPTKKHFEFVEQAWPILKEEMQSKLAVQEGPPSYPAFLSDKTEDKHRQFPDFHALFVRRMNGDQHLLTELHSHVDLERGQLESLLQMAERHGDDACDLLLALCAGQQLSAVNARLFTSPRSSGSSKHGWSKALDVHTRAASGTLEPCPTHCIALRYSAYQLLGHIQRRQAVRTLGRIKDRFSSQPQSTTTREERVSQSCAGIEEGLLSTSLFRGAQPAEVSRYIDLLALYVWSDMKSDEQFKESQAANREGRAARVASKGKATTRELLLFVEDSLRLLGFHIAEQEDESDFDNFFLSTSAICPAQRATSPLIFAALVSLICRRLGVAATLVDSPMHAMLTVIEQGQKPQDYVGSEEDWSRFFWIPLPGNDRIRQRCIFEGWDMASYFAKHSATSPTAARLDQDINKLLKPASPVVVLAKVAEEMLHAEQHGRRPADRARLDGGEAPAVVDSKNEAPHHQLSLLRDYLCGRSALPPWPLIPALLGSSLALLPHTKAGSKRVNPPDLSRQAEYCARWVLRIMQPERAGGLERFDEALARDIEKENVFWCDVALLLEVNGCNVKGEIDYTQRFVKKFCHEIGSLEGHKAGGGAEPPEAVNQLFMDICVEDFSSNAGVGGYGGNESRPRERELLDPAHERNVKVKHRIGAVMKHRQHGYRGVVVGWDSWYKLGDEGVTADENPRGGYGQPFYHVYAEDGSRKYVAQSNVVVACVPAGSTFKKATAVLREYAPLFSLHSVGRCFRTIEVAPWVAKGSSSTQKESEAVEAGKEGGSGQIRLVMNEWMKQAWPFG